MTGAINGAINGAISTVAPSIPIVHAIVLGAVQGLTEFFPVSSSGHLILVPWLFGWKELVDNPELNKTFDVALHVGTFIGAAAYFAPDLKRLAAGIGSSIRQRAVRTQDERAAWLLCLSAIPGAAAGALLEGFVQDQLGKEWLIGVVLIGFGLVLAAADRASGSRPEGSFAPRDAAVMALVQAAALAPGVSRSGITISAGRWLGFGRDGAARLSFLMSLPIIFGAGLYKGVKVFAGTGLPAGTGGAFAAGMATSAVTGLLAVWATIRLVRSRSFTPFVAYRVLAGLVVLGVAASGAR